MSSPRPASLAPSRASRDRAAAYFTEEQIGEAWEEAIALWGIEVNLSPPQPYDGGRADAWAGDEPLAFIDLAQRQVVVNLPLLFEIRAAESLPAVLAHELGHHLKFPHTLGLSASLQLLERKLLPGLSHSLTNLFFDLQVNEVVGRTRHAELVAVYRGFTERSGGEVSALFHFYLAIYEELWSLPAGALTSAAGSSAMEARFPGYRADARMFVQTFYALGDVYLQFVYFCSRFLRYLGRDDSSARLPLASDVALPDADDYAGALSPGSAEERAIEEAVEQGWIDAAVAPQAGGDESGQLSALQRALGGRPGTELRQITEVAAERLYKRLVERHLIRLPETSPPVPEPFLPTTAEEWEPGDGPRTIDWTLSVLARGPLAAVQPLRRELEAEPPADVPGARTAVEIYLDTSGSMPNPHHAVNAMTLAAQIVSAAALRRGGRVKALVYSIQVEESEWLYSEEAARRFLLRYSGGGTQFPFARLAALAEERPEAIRVVISDSDFLWNVQAKGAGERLVQALDRSQLLVALLALPKAAEARVREALGEVGHHPRFRLARVEDVGSLPQAAAQLTRALWGR